MKAAVLLVYFMFILSFFAGTIFMIQNYEWSTWWMVLPIIIIFGFSLKDV